MYRLVAVLLALVLAVAAFSQGHPPVKPVHPTVKQTAGSDNHPPSPTITATGSTGNGSSSVDGDNAKDGNGKADPESPDERIAKFTLYLVIVGAIQFAALVAQAVFIALTLILTKRTIEETKADTVANLAFAKAMAEAAQEQANISDKALKLVERPWIGLKPKTGKNFVGVEARNLGKTPAFIEFWGAQVYDKGMPDLAAVRETLNVPSGGVILPEQAFLIPAAHPGPVAWFGNTAPIMVSYAKYTDIHGIAHETCMAWRWSRGEFRFNNDPQFGLRNLVVNT